MKVKILGAGILILLVLSLLYCRKKQESGTSPVKKGGTVRIALLGSADNLFPFTIQEYFSQEISQTILNPGLTSFADNGDPVPQIARAWKYDARKKSLTYYLDPKFTWNDGQPVKAKDVLATYQFLEFNRDALQPAYKLTYVDSLQVIDSLTLRFVFNRDIAEPERWTRFAILNSRLMRDGLSLQTVSDRFNRDFIGCGPYVLKDRNEKELILLRNPYYPETVYLDSLIIRYYDSFNKIIAKGETGQIDVIPSLPVSYSNRASKFNGYRIIPRLESGFEFIAWNLQHPILKSKKVRLALTYAIDRQTLVDGLLSGYGLVHDTPAPPDYWAYLNERPLPYDPLKAKQLLAEDGWKEKEDQDGLVKGDRTLDLELLTNKENALRQQIMNNIRNYYQQVGVKVRTTVLPWDKLLKRLKKGQFDGAILSWGSNQATTIMELFHSSSIANGNNVMHYINPQVDKLLDEVNASTNRGLRREICLEAQKLIIEDRPVTVLFTKRELRIVNRHIKNVDFRGLHLFKNIRLWYIE